jgi:hypothetical protein
MKIFWSWQADTDGNIGRFFVRDALAEAIKHLKEPSDVEEPHERDLRDSIHLDHDRKDVSGTPSIADIIFGKIDQADVFVADVTPVASLTRLNPSEGEPPIKKVINSNVAIEYGYAVRSVTDERILLVQNTHYGNREDLPFDLKHKGSPIQYRLAPGASKVDIKAEMKRLVGVLIVALRACMVTLARTIPAVPNFEEVKSTTSRASFWEHGEMLAKYGDSFADPRHDDTVEYRFDESRALYLRLIPTAPPAEVPTFSKLMDIIQRRRVRVMTRTFGGGLTYSNKYGALYYEPSGPRTTPLAMTQLHRNGEIWAITREYMGQHSGQDVIMTGNVERRLTECLTNSIEVALEELGIEPPFQIEIGIVGMKGMCLSRPHEPGIMYVKPITDPIYDNEFHIRKFLNDVNPIAQAAIVK